MKKIFLSVLSVVFMATTANAADLVSASWDFIGDSVSTVYSDLQDQMIAGDTLEQNGISLFYYGSDFASKPLEKETSQGMYWRRSTSQDRAIVLTVPGQSKATIKYALRPAKTNNKYRMYLFAQENGTAPATFHGNWTNAIDSLDWQFDAYTVDTIAFNVDLMETKTTTDLYLLFLDLGQPDKKDNRLRGVSYEQTELAPDPTTDITPLKATSVKKMIVNGQVVIMKDEVKMNMLGF